MDIVKKIDFITIVIFLIVLGVLFTRNIPLYKTIIQTLRANVGGF
jgi:hypothetical protein